MNLLLCRVINCCASCFCAAQLSTFVHKMIQLTRSVLSPLQCKCRHERCGLNNESLLALCPQCVSVYRHKCFCGRVVPLRRHGQHTALHRCANTHTYTHSMLLLFLFSRRILSSNGSSSLLALDKRTSCLLFAESTLLSSAPMAVLAFSDSTACSLFPWPSHRVCIVTALLPYNACSHHIPWHAHSYACLVSTTLAFSPHACLACFFSVVAPLAFSPYHYICCSHLCH